MKYMFIILFCIPLVSVIYGASLKKSTSIDDDAKELTGLAEKIWSLKPSITKHSEMLLSCEVIDKCCKGKSRTAAAVFMSQTELEFGEKLARKIMNMCVNSTNSNKADRTCSTTVESIIPDTTIEKDPSVEEYFKIVQDLEEHLEMLPRWLHRSCEREHFQAFLCLSNTKLVEACAKEILQMAFDNDYIDYQAVVTTVKRRLTDILQKLLKKFPKGSNQE